MGSPLAAGVTPGTGPITGGMEESWVAPLLDWLRDGGAQIAPLRVGVREGERGLHATRRLAADLPALEIPRERLLTLEDARNSDFGKRLAASGLSPRSDDTWFAAFLLDLRSRAVPFWMPYLRSLPRAFPFNPLFFNPETLALLKGSLLLSALETRREELAVDHAALRAHGGDGFTWEDFVWARLVVLTRGFGVTVNGQRTKVLVPLADMFNCSPTPEVTWTYSEKQQAFVVYTVKEVPRGAELQAGYGSKCNSRFLLNYGFALEENPENRAALHFTVEDDGPQGARKRTLLGLLPGDQQFSRQASVSYDDKDTRRLFASLRTVCATEEELKQMDAVPQAAAQPLGVRNEEAVLQRLARSSEDGLRGFDTTLEEDDGLLRSGKLERSARSCVVLRRGEKQVLRAYAALAHVALPLLRLRGFEVEHWLATAPRQSLPLSLPRSQGLPLIDRYVRDAVLPLVRSQTQERLKAVGHRFADLLHPKAGKGE